MADFAAEIDFDRGLLAFLGTQMPSHFSHYTVPLAGTKRVAENVIAEGQTALSGHTLQSEYQAEHVDPRNICCSHPLCRPEPTCEAVTDARPSKRRALALNPKPSGCRQVAIYSNLESDQDQAFPDTLHDTFCRGYSPCASPECSPSNVCFDPHCGQVQECADQCSDPECSKGACPDVQCFCSKCCDAQPCPLEDVGDDCQLAHCPPNTTGPIHCSINESCHFTGYDLANPQLPFNGYLCPSTGHGTPTQGAIAARSPNTATPALSPTNYTSVDSVLSSHSSPARDPGPNPNTFPALNHYQCHVDTSCCQVLTLPSNGHSSTNQSAPGGWNLPLQHDYGTAYPYGNMSASHGTSTYGQHHSNLSADTMSWEQTVYNDPAVPNSQFSSGPFNNVITSWPHYEPKVESGVAPQPNKLDYLASAVQDDIVKSEFDESSKISDEFHSHQASFSRSPEPAPCVCRWQHMLNVPCLQTFDSPEALHRHLKTAHVENCTRCFCQWAGCESCAKDFKQRSKLSRHLLGHAGYRPYACSFAGCNKTFATNQAKDNHERTHTGHRPYVCSECGYTTTTHTQLYTHINALHEKKKRHKCRFCDFTCADSSNLSKHERTHQTLRPYRCPHEGCTFKPDCRWENLKRHLRRSDHCPELLIEGSEANRLYREKVKRETEEWQKRNEGNPMAATGRRRSRS